MNTKVTEHEVHPLDSVHDRQEEGIDEEELSSMEEYMWIEQHESLHIEIPQEVRPLSPLNLNMSARVKTIVKEYLRL